MTTEVVRCPFHPGQVPDEANKEALQALQNSLKEVTQVKGFQRLYWGREVENPDVFRLFVDWDSTESHINFTKTPEYKPFTERLGVLIDFSKILVAHAHIKPFPPVSVLSKSNAPVTEIISAYFPASFSETEQQSFHSGFETHLIGAAKATCPAFHSFAGGFVEEELEIPDSKGEKGRLWVGLLGWDSVQAHLDFRNTQDFKDNIYTLRGHKHLKSINVVHAVCTEMTKQ